MAQNILKMRRSYLAPLYSGPISSALIRGTYTLNEKAANRHAQRDIWVTHPITYIYTRYLIIKLLVPLRGTSHSVRIHRKSQVLLHACQKSQVLLHACHCLQLLKIVRAKKVKKVAACLATVQPIILHPLFRGPWYASWVTSPYRNR